MKKLWILIIPIIFVMIGSCAITYMGMGREAYDKGEYSKAIFLLKRATELTPQDGDSFRWLGCAYYNNGQYQEAIDALRKSLELPQTKGWEWYWLALAYDALEQYDLAISSQKKSIEITPDNSTDFSALSRYYTHNKQYDEAITAAKRAIELKSDNSTAYHYLGTAYGMKKQYDEAINALQKSIEIDPAWGTYDWMGRFFLETNDYNEAAEAYKKAIDLSPSTPWLHTSLATAYYRMGRYDDALATINRAIELQTISGDIGISFDIKDGYPIVKSIENMGPAKKEDIQVDDTITEIGGQSTEGWNSEQVAQSLKGTAGTQVVLTIERKDNKIKKAIARENFVLEDACTDIAMRSLIYRYKGSLDMALSDAEMASSLHPGYTYSLLSLGAAYLDHGRYDKSIKMLSRIEDNPAARLLEATAYVKQGKTNEAVNVYLSIPEDGISPKDIPLMNDRMVLLKAFKPFVKEHRDKARSFESNEQYKEALFELAEALKIADDTETQAIQEILCSMIRSNPSFSEMSEMPEDARKYALRGEMLAGEGNFEQAIAEFKKAIQIAPYATQSYYNAALIYAELKKYPEAVRYMNIYIKATPDTPVARAAKDEIIKWELMMEKGK